MIIQHEIHTDSDGWPQLRISIQDMGDDYGFTLHEIPEEIRPWLIDVIVSQYEKLSHRAYNDGRKSVQDQIKKALND